MRLNTDIAELKDKIKNLNNIPLTLQYDILHTIDALQRENERLKTENFKLHWEAGWGIKVEALKQVKLHIENFTMTGIMDELDCAIALINKQVGCGQDG